MRIRTFFTTGAAVLLALGTNGLAQSGQQKPAAQQPAQSQPPPAATDQPPQPPSPTFRAGINFVRVDTIVTDKSGNPINDLKEADFDVTEDGKAQKIESFKLIKLDGGAADAIKEPVKEIRTDYDEEAEAAREDVRLFAIFLDDYHVRKGTSMSVRKQLEQFVSTQLGPSDMIGVMYPLESTASVRMTRNHSAVVRGLDQFTGRKYDYQPMNQYEEKYAHYPAETVENIRNQVSLSALRSLISHLGSLKEGRKTLILVSEGYTNILPPQMRTQNAQIPGLGATTNPNAGVNDINEDRANWSAGLDMQDDLRLVYDDANKNNVAIYAVDPRGLPVFEFDINEGIGIQTDQQYLNSTMDTLRTLSESTDGRAIVNRNDIAVGMKQITRDASAYYLIGYNSTQTAPDGKFHPITVKVKRPGVQVRSRKGYWALTKEEAVRSATVSTKAETPKPVENAIAAIGSRSRTDIVRTWIGTSRGENGKTRVTFVWEPMPKSATGPAMREEPARVSLMAVGGDGSPYFRGRVPDVALASASPSSAAGGQGAAVAHGPSRVSFDVAPGKMQLRVSVEGAASQVLDTEMRDITVPDLTKVQSALGTPEVFRARTARDFTQLKADMDAVPSPLREFSRTDRLLIRVPVYGPGETTPALSVHLLNRAGSAMNEIPSAPSGKPNVLQIEVPLAGLAPGEYVIELKAGDDDSAKQLVAFRVTA